MNPHLSVTFIVSLGTVDLDSSPPSPLMFSSLSRFDLMNKNVSHEKKELMLTSRPSLILTTFSSLVLARRGRPDELRGQRFLF